MKVISFLNLIFLVAGTASLAYAGEKEDCVQDTPKSFSVVPRDFRQESIGQADMYTPWPPVSSIKERSRLFSDLSMFPGDDELIRKNVIEPLIGTPQLAQDFYKLPLDTQILKINTLQLEAYKNECVWKPLQFSQEEIHQRFTQVMNDPLNEVKLTLDDTLFVKVEEQAVSLEEK